MGGGTLSRIKGNHQGWVELLVELPTTRAIMGLGPGWFRSGASHRSGGWGWYSSLIEAGGTPVLNPYYYSAPATVVVQAAGPCLRLFATDQHPERARLVRSRGTTRWRTFDEARAAFFKAATPQALQKTRPRSCQMPNDPTLHEFRALVLFAQEASTTPPPPPFAVLSTRPRGLDHDCGLYPQLRTSHRPVRVAEDFTRANRTSLPPTFVLAYHYLTQGYTKRGGRAQEVTRLQQPMHLFRLLAQIAKPRDDARAAAPPPPLLPPPPVSAPARSARPSAPLLPRPCPPPRRHRPVRPSVAPAPAPCSPAPPIFLVAPRREGEDPSAPPRPPHRRSAALFLPLAPPLLLLLRLHPLRPSFLSDVGRSPSQGHDHHPDASGDGDFTWEVPTSAAPADHPGLDPRQRSLDLASQTGDPLVGPSWLAIPASSPSRRGGGPAT